jgi:hypothetical protein
MNSIECRNLKVDTVLAVVGQQPVPLAEVVSAIERQVQNAGLLPAAPPTHSSSSRLSSPLQSATTSVVEVVCAAAT